MRPIVADGVAWSVGLSVSVCHDPEPCKNGWTNWDVVLGGPKKPRRWSRSPRWRSRSPMWGAILRERSDRDAVRDVDLPVSPRKHLLDGAARWCHLVNTLHLPCAAAMRPFC